MSLIRYSPALISGALAAIGIASASISQSYAPFFIGLAIVAYAVGWGCATLMWSRPMLAGLVSAVATFIAVVGVGLLEQSVAVRFFRDPTFYEDEGLLFLVGLYAPLTGLLAATFSWVLSAKRRFAAAA